MFEQWHDIHGFEEIYQVSTYCKVRRFWPNSDNEYKMLNPWIDSKTGYKRVDLCVKSKKDIRRVHQLVLETFIGPRQQLMEARHLDGNKLNNRLDNLQWGTKSENQKDRKRHGNPSIGGNFKLTQNQVRAIKHLLQCGGETHSRIAEMFGVKRSAITDINTGKTWSVSNEVSE